MTDNTCDTCAFFGKDNFGKPACEHDEVSTFCDCMGNSVGRPDFGCINHQRSLLASFTELPRCCATCAHWGLDLYDNEDDDKQCHCSEVVNRVVTHEPYVSAEFYSAPSFCCSHWEEQKPAPITFPPFAAILCPPALFKKVAMDEVDHGFVEHTVRIHASDYPVLPHPLATSPVYVYDYREVPWHEEDGNIDRILKDKNLFRVYMDESMFPLREED
jgi:hypothetical protein